LIHQLLKCLGRVGPLLALYLQVFHSCWETSVVTTYVI
jgi:hypothetical protein